MRTIQYAAYGSNLHPLRLARRVPSARFLGKSHLPDWSLHFHKRSKDSSGKCNIQPHGDGVCLAVFEFDENEKLALDAIEGLGMGYDEIALDLPGFGRCYSYQASVSHVCSELNPFDWYTELVLLGCRELGFPNAYVSRIEETRSIRDPDQERRRENWELVDLLRNGAAGFTEAGLIEEKP